MFGFLIVDKPRDVTSRHVVNVIQRLVRPRKVGHAGTLDPLASGVLLVAIGPATRLVDYVHRLAKTYSATFVLGRRSDTEDITGQVTELDDPPHPPRSQIEAVLPGMLGEIWQRPPAFSALKIRGERAYDLARRGESVDLAARKVHIHRLVITAYDYPELQLDMECSTGTYVRSLGRDLAQAIGTEAVLSELTRTAIGCFPLSEACPLRELTVAVIGQQLIAPETVFVGERPEPLSDADVRRVRLGQTIELPRHDRIGDFPALDCTGRLVAVLRPLSDNQSRPVLTFPQDP
jgi:tRNA pseudouridine55 synthase